MPIIHQHQLQKLGNGFTKHKTVLPKSYKIVLQTTNKNDCTNLTEQLTKVLAAVNNLKANKKGNGFQKF